MFSTQTNQIRDLVYLVLSGQRARNEVMYFRSWPPAKLAQAILYYLVAKEFQVGPSPSFHATLSTNIFAPSTSFLYFRPAAISVSRSLKL